MTTTIEHINNLCTQVIEHHAGHISTHYETCWRNHAGCLAVLIRDALEDE